MSDSFGRFMLAQEELSHARTAHDAVGYRLEVKGMKCRYAELVSQDIPSIARGKLHDAVGTLTPREKEVALAFARYVVCGRTDQP